MSLRKIPLNGLILVLMSVVSGCYESESDIKIKELNQEKNILNIKLAKANRDISNINNDYSEMKGVLKSSSSKELSLIESNSELRVSLAKVQSELKSELEKNEKLNSQLSSKSSSDFNEENREKLESEFYSKYSWLFMFLLFSLSSLLGGGVYQYFKKKNRIELESFESKKEGFLNEKSDLDEIIKNKDIDIFGLNKKLSEAVMSHKYEVDTLKRKMAESSSNDVVDKINEMQQSRLIKLSTI